MSKKTYQHWQLNLDDDGIYHVVIDRQATSTNTLHPDVLAEFAEILTTLENDDAHAKGVIIQSAKSSFIAGADVHYLADAAPQVMWDYLTNGYQLINRLAALRIPTVAAIHGFCFGGGLEFALACRYRIATDDPSTRLGLPEVKLGIFPAWGGIHRLAARIGGLSALDLMLSGRAIHAKVARKLRLVDDVVPQRQLAQAANAFIQQKPARKKPSLIARGSNLFFIRPLLANVVEKKLQKKICKEHYPAPFSIVNVWKKYGTGTDQNTELKILKQLVEEHSTAKNLIRVFQLQESLKKLAKKSEENFNRVHVIGAGTMGAGIAAWCALQGCTVTLEDKNLEALAHAKKQAQRLFSHKLKESHLIQAAHDRLLPDLHGTGLAHADIVIEAVFEDLAVKHDVFKRIEANVHAKTVIATNTSSIKLEDIARVLKHPQRLIGIHFFNPVAKMQLVEVIHAEKTDENCLQRGLQFVRTLNRLPVPVKSSPGFLVNRVLMPYLLESVRLLEEGVPAYLIDKSALEFGMPMGPIELADTVGLDVCLAVAENLTKHFGGDVPEQLREKVNQGDLGVKSGKGFYLYDQKGDPIKETSATLSSGETNLSQRLIMRMINEAAACLREGIVANADQLDAAMIFGTGFAPFRGGPMHYAQTLGQRELQRILKELSQRYGQRYKADTGWGSVFVA